MINLIYWFTARTAQPFKNNVCMMMCVAPRPASALIERSEAKKIEASAPPPPPPAPQKEVIRATYDVVQQYEYLQYAEQYGITFVP